MPSEPQASKKQHLLNSITDGVSKVFYYDRNDDEDLSPDDVNELIKNREVTLRELVDQFKGAILENYPDIKVD